MSYKRKTRNTALWPKSDGTRMYKKTTYPLVCISVLRQTHVSSFVTQKSLVMIHMTSVTGSFGREVEGPGVEGIIRTND